MNHAGLDMRVVIVILGIIKEHNRTPILSCSREAESKEEEGERKCQILVW
jgi:hypothetical protein